MKTKNILIPSFLLLTILVGRPLLSQVPVASFSVSANPACTNSLNAIQVTDLSTNSPMSWSYTVAILGPGPGGTMVFTSQNPSVSFNFQGTYTITLVAVNAIGASAPFSQTVSVLRSPDAVINPVNVNSCPGASAININVFPNGPGGSTYSYLWSTGATTSFVTVSPASTTSYSCVITATNGCSNVKTSTIVVGQPTVLVSSNPVNICPGTNGTLTASISGQGPYFFLWSNGATSSSITTSVPCVYTATVTNGLGCAGSQAYALGASATLSLTAVAVPSTICIGNNGVLLVSGASNYTWSNGANSPNILVNPVSATIYSVVGQTGNCLGSTTVMLNVSFNPSITVVSNTNSICFGNSVTINASGAASFTWNPGGIVSQSITVAPGVSTTYSVRGVNPGCQPGTSGISINVMPNPVVSIATSASVICTGEHAALVASGANSYLWNTGSTSAIILESPIVTTVYSVTGTSLNSCSSITFFVQNVASCTGMDELTKNGFMLYPNPSSQSVQIESSSQEIKIMIIDQAGQSVKEIFLNGNSKALVDVTELTNGLYLVVGQTNRGVLKQKLIIRK